MKAKIGNFKHKTHQKRLIKRPQFKRLHLISSFYLELWKRFEPEAELIRNAFFYNAVCS